MCVYIIFMSVCIYIHTDIYKIHTYIHIYKYKIYIRIYTYIQIYKEALLVGGWQSCCWLCSDMGCGNRWLFVLSLIF